MIILLFFLSFFAEHELFAESLLKSNSCIIGKNSNPGDIKKISTMGASCSNKCEKLCLNKFRLISPPKTDGKSAEEIKNIKQKFLVVRERMIEVNKDKIEECLASCYQSRPYEGTIRVPIVFDYTGRPENDPQKPYPWACEIDPKVAAKDLLDVNCFSTVPEEKTESDLLCSPDELTDNILDSDQNLAAGDRLIVSLINGPQAPNFLNVNNGLYLCGFKTKFFTPTYLNRKGEEIMRGDFHYSQALETGIEVRDKDLLQISYFGRYYSFCPNGVCKFKQDDYNLDIKFGKKSLDMISFQRIDADQVSRDQCKICGENQEAPICKKDVCQIFLQKDNFKYGLSQIMTYKNNPEIFLETFDKNYDSPIQFRSNIILGQLQGLGANSHDVIFAYPGGFRAQDARGGYFTSVTWRGCHYDQGERLQYLIINAELPKAEEFDDYLEEAPWKDLQLDPETLKASLVVQEGDLNIPSNFNKNNLSATKKTATILFRIKGLTTSEVKAMDIHNFSKELAIGSYHLGFLPATSSPVAENILDKLLTNEILSFPEKLFKFITQHEVYINVIRALIAAYLMMVAISFIIGTSQISQQEAITVIFKIAIVLALISEKSFEFFNSHLLQAFTLETMNTIANLVTPNIEINWGAGMNSQTSCFTNPAIKIKLLCVMYKDFAMLGDWTFWQRIVGMIFTGLFLPAIGLIISIILYIFVILKVTFMYFVGIILVIITVSLAPFFIPMILFKYTKGFFDGWIKQLMVFIMQPLFIFTSISLFRLVFIQVMQLLFGVNACKICLFNFWGLIDCPDFMNVYVAINAAATGEGGSIFMLSNLVALLIIGYGMNSFYTFAAQLSSRLINWLSQNLAHSNVGAGDLLSQTASLGSSLMKPAELLSMDDKSYQERARFRRERRQKEQSGKKDS